MRIIALLLAGIMASAPALARAQDAGVALPVPPAGTVVLPGQSMELKTGTPAPFDGNLSDKARWAFYFALRDAAEAQAKAATLAAQDAQARKEAAEHERDAVKAAQGPGWGVLFGTTGTALVLGTVLGMVIWAVKK